MKYISDYAFTGCSALTSISIPEGVPRIGDSMFSGCNRLEIVNIPDSVTYIGHNAFNDCKIKSIVISDHVTSIGKYAFQNCRELTDINIPESVISIGIQAFNNTGYYNTESNWENGALYIGRHLISVDKETVSGEFTVKAGTISIAESVFAYCSELTGISIPESVTIIAERTFSGCDKLREINYSGTIAEWKAIKKAYMWNEGISACVVHCTDGDISI